MADAAGVLSRDALIGLYCYWRQKRFAYDVSGNIEYIGFHPDSDYTSAQGGWAIWKHTYTGSNLTLIEGPLTGAWDNRALLDWV